MKTITIIASLCLALSLATAHKVVKGRGSGRPGAVAGEAPVFVQKSIPGAPYYTAEVWIDDGALVHWGVVSTLHSLTEMMIGETLPSGDYYIAKPAAVELASGRVWVTPQYCVLHVVGFPPPPFSLNQGPAILPAAHNWQPNRDRVWICRVICTNGSAVCEDGACGCFGMATHDAPPIHSIDSPAVYRGHSYCGLCWRPGPQCVLPPQR